MKPEGDGRVVEVGWNPYGYGDKHSRAYRPRPRRAGIANEVSAAEGNNANNDVPGATPRYDTNCPFEALKMTPVSLYNVRHSRALNKEGS